MEPQLSSFKTVHVQFVESHALRSEVTPPAGPARSLTGLSTNSAAPARAAKRASIVAVSMVLPSRGRWGPFHAPLYIYFVILHTKQTGGMLGGMQTTLTALV